MNKLLYTLFLDVINNGKYEMGSILFYNNCGRCDFGNDKKTKKELQEKYKEREIIGGIYAIRNTLNNKMLLEATTDLQGSKNRFEFSKKTGSCVHMKLQDDWNNQGSGQFVFEMLEELKKGNLQADKDFKADIHTLKEMWLDKLSDKDLY